MDSSDAVVFFIGFSLGFFTASLIRLHTTQKRIFHILDGMERGERKRKLYLKAAERAERFKAEKAEVSDDLP